MFQENRELLKDFSDKKHQVILNVNKHSLDPDEDTVKMILINAQT